MAIDLCLPNRDHLLCERADTSSHLFPACGEPTNLVPQLFGVAGRDLVGQGVDGAFQFVCPVLTRGAEQEDAQVPHRRWQFVSQHGQGLVAGASHQDPLPLGEQGGDQVGDRVCLAGARRPLHHYARVVFQSPQHTPLSLVRLARKERVISEQRRDLANVPVRSFLGVQGQHQLSQPQGACPSEATLSAIRS